MGKWPKCDVARRKGVERRRQPAREKKKARPVRAGLLFLAESNGGSVLTNRAYEARTAGVPAWEPTPAGGVA